MRMRWRGTRTRGRCGFRFRQEDTEIIEDIARILNQLRALLDEAIGTLCARRVDVSGHRVNEPALLERLRGGDQCAAVQASFNHENAMTPAADDSVPHRECLTIRFDLHGELRHDRPVSVGNFFRERKILGRIKLR